MAVIVEALTDNRNRTAGEVRSAFTKFGGSLGETNSVSFMFDRVGITRYPKDKINYDALFEAALEAGAQNLEETDKGYEIECRLEDFATVRDELFSKSQPDNRDIQPILLQIRSFQTTNRLASDY